MWINEHRRCFQRSVDPHNERRLFFLLFLLIIWQCETTMLSTALPPRYAINRVLSSVEYWENVTPISTERREVVSSCKHRFRARKRSDPWRRTYLVVGVARRFSPLRRRRDWQVVSPLFFLHSWIHRAHKVIANCQVGLASFHHCLSRIPRILSTHYKPYHFKLCNIFSYFYTSTSSSLNRSDLAGSRSKSCHWIVEKFSMP